MHERHKNGCVSLFSKSIIEALWEQAENSVKEIGGQQTDLVIPRTGWKTVRIFVSSTFKDFHQEREILVKKVFPQLRAWCEPQKLFLVECDLRWRNITMKKSRRETKRLTSSLIIDYQRKLSPVLCLTCPDHHDIKSAH
ncbi:hypothetical protein LSAT2_003024 [Lamellibrachia satsuma]|nr:hypothetical protein LSAT2_003024 [Lamellibrachia satsuma]